MLALYFWLRFWHSFSGSVSAQNQHAKVKANNVPGKSGAQQKDAVWKGLSAEQERSLHVRQSRKTQLECQQQVIRHIKC